MALCLGVKAGDRISVGVSELVVDALLTDGTIFITVENEQYQITDKRREEILPSVFVSCGLAASARRDKFSKLAFEAPRSIKIMRQDA